MVKFRLNVAIIGSTGYTGIELIRLLSFHKKVDIKYLISEHNYGKKIFDFYPALKYKNYPKLIKFSKINWKDIDLVFLCQPSGESKKKINKIPKNITIIDLSNDFRLNSLTKNTWIYGLADHLNDFSSKKKNEGYSNKVANPGCYATSVLSPLIPLLNNNFIESKDIIIDAKSGISGAGKKNVTENLFSEISNTLRPYKIANHKHIIEIENCLKRYNNNKNVTVSFTPHVIPINRGISSNIYLKLKKGKKIQDIRNFFEQQDYLFLKLLNKDKIPLIKDVVGTNYCFFNIFEDRIKNRIILISVIDNLIKGASGQAIHNMNLLFNFKEDEGLLFNPNSI